MMGSSSALTAVPRATSSASGCGFVALEDLGLELRLGSTATTTPSWRGVGEARTSRTASAMSLGTAYLHGARGVARGAGRGARSAQCVVGGESSAGPDEGGGRGRGGWGVVGGAWWGACHRAPVAQLLQHDLHRRVAHGEVAGGGGALVALEAQLDLVQGQG